MEVLLVDDQPVTVQVYAALVRKTFSGARVHVAVDLPEALQIAAGRALDLVLLDLMLPTSSGVETLGRFRRAFPNLPVLVVAASEDKDLIRACLDGGARGYVPKTSALLALGGALQSVAAGGRHIPPEAQRPSLKPAANGG
jgi:two-component system, NarL family, nitrate/nitrite response regulator NarL